MCVFQFYIHFHYTKIWVYKTLYPFCDEYFFFPIKIIAGIQNLFIAMHIDDLLTFPTRFGKIATEEVAMCIIICVPFCDFNTVCACDCSLACNDLIITIFDMGV
jgi:hypothetical protein